MMIMLTMAATLIGAMLGLRFKVLILVPATVICSAATLGVGVVYSDNPWSILLAMVLAIAALQIGYLVGTVVAGGPRVSKDLPETVSLSQRPAH